MPAGGEEGRKEVQSLHKAKKYSELESSIRMFHRRGHLIDSRDEMDTHNQGGCCFKTHQNHNTTLTISTVAGRLHKIRCTANSEKEEGQPRGLLWSEERRVYHTTRHNILVPPTQRSPSFWETAYIIISSLQDRDYCLKGTTRCGSLQLGSYNKNGSFFSRMH